MLHHSVALAGMRRAHLPSTRWCRVRVKHHPLLLTRLTYTIQSDHPTARAGCDSFDTTASDDANPASSSETGATTRGCSFRRGRVRPAARPCGSRLIARSKSDGTQPVYAVRRYSTHTLTASRLSRPVAIVGAGPAGLTLSALLSQFGVPSVLLEKASELPTHPQAHFINLRSMEVLRHAFGGLDVDVLERCPPREEWRSAFS